VAFGHAGRERNPPKHFVREGADRLDCIGHQVEEDLLQLIAVAQHHRAFGTQIGLQLDAVQLQLIRDEQ